jgi:hypothetical protein
MKFNWLQIYEGWINHLIPTEALKEKILETSVKRLEICRTCDWNSKNAGKYGPERCLDCGCPLIAKTKCLSCYCELSSPKWEAMLTEEQEEIINNNDDTG